MQHLHFTTRLIRIANLKKMTMLEYSKMILEKVSFDPGLFKKELYKALNKLLTPEISELKKWCVEKFGWAYCVSADPEFSL